MPSALSRGNSNLDIKYAVAYIRGMEKNTGDKRVIIPLTSELLETLDDWRFANRMPSRAEAIRELIRRGMKRGKDG